MFQEKHDEPLQENLFLRNGIIYLTMVILLEVGLRFLPVQESMEWLPVNEANPVRRFEPNRWFTWSKKWSGTMNIPQSMIGRVERFEENLAAYTSGPARGGTIC